MDAPNTPLSKSDKNLVWLDCEMTGLEPDTDRLLDGWYGARVCREDVFRTPQAGKIGWGAAWTYRVGKHVEDAAIARDVVDGFIALQQPDGSWADIAYDQHTVIDVTAEMTGLMAAVGVVLHD